MLRTVLLLDGSAAMNVSSDYLPSYLLASRPPLMQFVNYYLDSTPLASLGVVVMRHGVAVKLLAPTTNVSELVQTLEQEYFLYGGAGALSLENGLRMALSELAQLKPRTRDNINNNKTRRGKRRVLLRSHTMQPRVVLLSAAVTLIDPTDVLKIIHVMASLHIRVDIISFNGAVHVFEECAHRTGGLLWCPLNYDHLHRLMKEMAFVTNVHVPYAHHGKRLRSESIHPESNDNNNNNINNSDASPMIPIGFPVYLHQLRTVHKSLTVKSEEPTREEKNGIETQLVRYLACPRCYLIQTSIPSTCALCKLLLCSVPMMYSTFILHNPVSCSPAETLVNKNNNDNHNSSNDENKTNRVDQVISSETATTEEVNARNCSTCSCRLDNKCDVQFRCTSCKAVRCEWCQLFIVHQLQLCPTCVALREHQKKY